MDISYSLRTVKSVFTTPLLLVLYLIYGAEKIIKRKGSAGEMNLKDERQRKLLARLGLVQMMFDFYAAPVA